jgi:two-component system chemotaxis response regulator CheV
VTSKASHSQGLLLFKLHNGHPFALGTLKIRELVPYQPVTAMVQSPPGVVGAVNIRGQTLPILDMAQIIGYGATPAEKLEQSYILVTDCQRKTVGFLVDGIDRIVEADWKHIKSPPKTLGGHVFITGTTEVNGEVIQLMDVELLLSMVYSGDTNHLDVAITDIEREKLKPLSILVVDDSITARKQLTDVLSHLNIPFEVTDNGSHALEIMREKAKWGEPIDLLVSDIEMPGLDGYELTFEVRNDTALKDAYIILHTSLSSEISVGQAHQVGANEALEKFDARSLIDAMLVGADHLDSQ